MASPSKGMAMDHQHDSDHEVRMNILNQLASTHSVPQPEVPAVPVVSVVHAGVQHAVLSMPEVHEVPPPVPARTRRIAMFGSSLNPVTHAHVAIVDALAAMHPGARNQGRSSSVSSSSVSRACFGGSEDADGEFLYDEVWVLPVFTHADAEKYRHLADVPGRTPEQEEQYQIFLKKSALRDSYNQRLELCRIAFAGRARVMVKDHERTLWSLFPTYREGPDSGPARTNCEHYPGTLHLARWMLGKERYPGQGLDQGDFTFAGEQAGGTQYAWFMGQDTWGSYAKGRWVGGYELQTLFSLINAPRDGIACGPLPSRTDSLESGGLDDLVLPRSSSTLARASASVGSLDGLLDQVPKEVAGAILEAGMYTLKHTQGVPSPPPPRTTDQAIPHAVCTRAAWV